MNTRLPHRLLGALGLAVMFAGLSASLSAQASPTRQAAVKITVFKDPGCGCCKEWVEHLRRHAFEVTAKDTSGMAAVKRTARVPENLHSCHTAIVNGYVVEGHVPAADIHRMLNEKPRIAGIAAPGMPVGSPGMEVGNRRDRYDVIAFNRDGTTKVFASH